MRVLWALCPVREEKCKFSSANPFWFSIGFGTHRFGMVLNWNRVFGLECNLSFQCTFFQFEFSHIHFFCSFICEIGWREGASVCVSECVKCCAIVWATKERTNKQKKKRKKNNAYTLCYALRNEICHQSNVVNRKEKELAIVASVCERVSVWTSVCARVCFSLFLLFVQENVLLLFDAVRCWLLRFFVLLRPRQNYS